MAAATRFVERLHLRADSESAVRRILPCLEDAFRTATLPDTAARLIFVRRLHLGRLPRGASAQSLSLAIESRFSGGDWQPVHAAAAGAAGAPAVWFRDPLEAHEVAALRTAAGQPVDAWFWPLAIPALAESSSPADRLRTIAFSLATLEEAPAALPAWTTSLAQTGRVRQLLTALQPGDGTALLRAAGIAVPPATADRSIDRRRSSRPHRAAPNGLEANAVRPTPVRREVRDDRHDFIEQMLAASSYVLPRQQPTTSPSEPATGDVGLLNRPESAPGSNVSLDRRPPQRRAFASGRYPPEQHSEPHRGFHRTPQDFAEPSRSTIDPIEAARLPRPFIDAAPTAAGGLLFLAPVLERLGFPEWCADRRSPLTRPDSLARQIFHVLLSRLRVAEDDPAWMVASPPDGASRMIPEIWLTGCRRLLRRRVRIGLASLVLRPARLTFTTTHVDVFFTLNAADVRVRRAGLDLDPGWVPWLRRVVSFHYGEHAYRDTAR
ncbi:MAG TPA: hypothetical protein VFT24_03300 [Vicinamibacterales bacterium]|nr:hypothetical protein [Vicinamibacterales bacterium]